MDMEVDVYVDLLFLINAGMDGLCLCLTGRLLHRRLSPLRILAASLAGGLYAVLSLFLEMGQAMALLVDLAVCCLICVVAFFGKGGRRLFSVCGVYFLLSLVVGGVMTGLYSLFNRLGLGALLADSDADGPEAWLFALIALLGGAVTLWGGRMLHRGAVSTSCTLTVELGERRITLTGMLDTGNLLRDPMGGRMVVCVDPRAILAALPRDLAVFFSEDGHDASLLTPSSARRLRIIPAGSATGSGMLYGFLPDRVLLSIPHKESREVDVVLALTRLEGVDALIPAELTSA